MPPSGPWTGYYLYGYDGARHRMHLSLTFDPAGRIEGQGVDDIAAFVIKGRYDPGTSAVHWTKIYIGMHAVEYSGLYCQRTICGDWALSGITGGFWIWPRGSEGSEMERAEQETDSTLELLAESD